jgi:tetratricopeptide (TPR) repeat protein
MAVGGAALFCSLVAGEARPQPGRPGTGGRPAQEPPWKRVLTGGDAERVEGLEQTIDELQKAAKFGEARGPARAALAIRTRAQGAGHWETANAQWRVRTLEQIAALPRDIQGEMARAREQLAESFRLHEQGKYGGEGERLLRRALATRVRVLGEEHPDTALVYNNLAQTLTALSKYAEAEVLGRKALATRRRLLGEGHPDTAASYSNLAVTLDELGRHPEAEPLHQKALAIRRRVLGEEHADTAESYGNLALNMSDQGKYAEALPLKRRALAIVRRVLGEGHPRTALSYSNLATTLDELGRHAEADPLHRKALAITRTARGEEHAETATRYNNLARNLEDQEKYAEAEPLLRKALGIAGRVLGEGHADTAQSYLNLGGNLFHQGKYAEAEPPFRQALAIYLRVLGEAHPSTAVSYNNLASNLRGQGKYAEAEPLFRKALAVLRDVLGEGHPHTAASYETLAANLNAQGKHAEAESLHRHVLALHRRLRGEEHPATAASYNNVASTLAARHKYREAQPLFEKALAVFRKALGEVHSRTAACYNNVGLNLHDQGKFTEAAPCFEKALAITRKVLGEGHVSMATGYNSLAVCLTAQGDLAGAETCHRKSLAILRRTLGEEHPRTVTSRSNLAESLSRQGKHAEAEAELAAAADGFDRARLRIAFTGLGRVTFASERSPLPALAAVLARNGKAAAAWERLEAHCARGLFDELARPWRDDERNRERHLLWRLQQLDEQITRAEERRQRLETLQTLGEVVAPLLPRSGGRAVLASPDARERIDPFREQAEALRKGRDTVQADLSRFEADMVAKYGVAGGKAYARPRIQARLPAGAALVAWLDIEAAPRAAHPGGHHWACVLRHRGEPVWVRLPGSGPGGAWADDDSQLPERVREALADPSRAAGGGWHGLVRQLYAQRLAPLEGHLRGEPGGTAVKHLVVLPSPALAGVPLEALADRYTVSYAPSGTMFAWLREKGPVPPDNEGTPAPPHLLAVGDPVFAPPEGSPPPAPRSPDLGVRTGRRAAAEAVRERRAADQLLRASRGPVVPRLPSTRREVEAIARLFADPRTLLGSEASEQALAQLAASGELGRFRFVHVATHGVLHREAPMRSALLLSQDQLPDAAGQLVAGKEFYDGRLTAERILRTWRLDADLVTLSACETGLGRPSGGEGHLGFAQALFVAGARSLVLSLWKVDDTATALLMTRFYQNLLGQRQGLGAPMAKAAALQEAKSWLRNLTAEEVVRLRAQLPGTARGEEKVGDLPPPTSVRPYEHPFYWAAFILIGDPGELPEGSARPPRATGWSAPWFVGGGLVAGGLLLGAAVVWGRRRCPGTTDPAGAKLPPANP